jgi:hypothetical protein
MLNTPNTLSGVPSKIAQAAVTASPVAIYTVPASQRCAIEDIHICNTTAGALTINLFAGADATTASALLYGYSIAANSSYHLTCFIVLNAGDLITVTGSGLGLTTTLSGFTAI